jgi:hypothetical protein
MNRAFLVGLSVPPLAALVRVVAAVFPGQPLNLKPGFYLAGLKVDVRPAQPESFTLANAERQGDRPASAVAAMSDNVEDFSNLLPSQYVGFRFFGGWRLYERGHVTADSAAAHRGSLVTPSADVPGQAEQTRSYRRRSFVQ